MLMYLFSIFAPSVLIGVMLLLVWRGKPGFQQEFRDKAEGLADILRYNKPVWDGVVLGKGGELMAGFYFRGIDLDSSSNDEIAALMARLNMNLKRFGDGWMAHIDALRGSEEGYPSGGEFHHPILKLMNEERRLQFEAEGRHFDSSFVVTLTYRPPLRIEARAAEMLFEHSEERTGNHNDLAKRTLEKFEIAVTEFGVGLKHMMKDVQRLRRTATAKSPTGSQCVSDDLAAYFHYCATGVKQPIVYSLDSLPDLDAVIGSQDTVGGTTPRVGDQYIRVISLEGYPSEFGPLVLESLNRLPVKYRWNTRFIFFDPETARSVIGRIRKKWRQKLRPMVDQVLNRVTGPVDQDAAKMSGDAENAMGEATSGAVRHGHYTSVIVLMDKQTSALDDATELITGHIRNLGFTCRVETINAVEAYLGSLPGHGYENVRRPLAHTLNLAYLFPASAIWGGVKKHPCRYYPPNSPPLFMADASGGTPFGGVMHYGDVGHALLVGPTRSGKSTALQFFIAQHYRYKDANVYLFEKGASGFVLCTSTGGRYFNIGADDVGAGKWRFAPLADVDKPSVRIWAEDWISVCCEIQGHQVSPGDREKIREAMKKVAKTNNREERTMSLFISQLSSTELQSVLKEYSVSGSCPFVDGLPSEESIEFSRYNIFEMEHLMDMGERHIVPILLYLFHKIERSLKGKPTILALDEAWLMFSHPLFRDRIRKWLKTLAKANVGVWFATQELVDIANSSIKDVIYASCPTKILLPNTSARQGTAYELYKEIGLNEQQIDLLVGAQPARDYYYMSPYGNRMFSLSLGRMNLAFAGVSGKEDVQLARDLQEKLGEAWVVEWARRKAGADWADAVNHSMFRLEKTA